MSNYIKHNGSITFHPGYYIEEIIEDMGLTQQEFAQRLDTTPKNISKLVNGGAASCRRYGHETLENAGNEHRVLAQPAERIRYRGSPGWICGGTRGGEEDSQAALDYSYFRDQFGLPDSPRRLDDCLPLVCGLLSL